MIDPVSIAAIKGACDVAIGALPQIFPLVHDETTRKRLARLDILLQRVEDGSLTSEELTEAKKLHSKIHVHALMIQNATIMTYLKKGMLLLGAKMSGTAEEQVDLIMMDEDCEERLTQENSITRSPPTPMSVKFKASIPEVAKFISFDERSLLFDASGFITQYIAPSEAAQPAYSSRSSATISSLRDEEEKEDPIIEVIANAKIPQIHTKFKKAACRSLVLTTGSIALLAPQVRRNLLRSRTVPRSPRSGHAETDSHSSRTSLMTRSFFSQGLDAALVARKQHQTVIRVSEY